MTNKRVLKAHSIVLVIALVIASVAEVVYIYDQNKHPKVGECYKYTRKNYIVKVTQEGLAGVSIELIMGNDQFPVGTTGYASFEGFDDSVVKVDCVDERGRIIAPVR